jgi:hypothetical protein
LKAEYLDSADLFRTIPNTSGTNRRDFVGKILTMNLIDHDHGSYSYQQVNPTYNSLTGKKPRRKQTKPKAKTD